MANPGPNIVAESGIRAQSVVGFSITGTSITAGLSAEYTVTINGLAVGDIVCAQGSTGNATIMLGAYVSAANTLKVRVLNPTAGALTPGNTGYSVLVVRPYPSAANTVDFLVTSAANSGAIPLSA